MFGLFEKKEPVKTWGNYKKYDYCNDCHHMECFIGEDFESGVCPKCGSEETGKVISRWLKSAENGVISAHGYEIKK